MTSLTEFIRTSPVVPYIRQCDFAIRKPWKMPERRLLDYLLVYVQEGRCLFTVDGRPYELRKGDFCLIQPGSLNILEGLTDTVTPFAHFDLFYHPDRELSFPTRAGQTDLHEYRHLMQPRLDQLAQTEIPVKLRPANPGKLRDTFLKAVEYWQYPDLLLQLRAQSAMTEAAIMILEDVLPQNPAWRAASPALNWISSYFSFHLSDPLSVEDMARRAHLSPSRFHELFKQQYGTTPHQYLMDMRISHACELLRNTALTQEQIAVYCGFSNVHHFSKAFKRKIGMPPGQFRANHGSRQQ